MMSNSLKIIALNLHSILGTFIGGMRGPSHAIIPPHVRWRARHGTPLVAQFTIAKVRLDPLSIFNWFKAGSIKRKACGFVASTYLTIITVCPLKFEPLSLAKARALRSLPRFRSLPQTREVRFGLLQEDQQWWPSEPTFHISEAPPKRHMTSAAWIIGFAKLSSQLAPSISHVQDPSGSMMALCKAPQHRVTVCFIWARFDKCVLSGFPFEWWAYIFEACFLGTESKWHHKSKRLLLTTIVILRVDKNRAPIWFWW